MGTPMENVLVTLASKICLTPDQTTTPKDGSPTATDLAAHEENHSGPTTGQPRHRNYFDFLLKIFSSQLFKILLDYILLYSLVQKWYYSRSFLFYEYQFCAFISTFPYILMH